jgi:hypothetical protein
MPTLIEWQRKNDGKNKEMAAQKRKKREHGHPCARFSFIFNLVR